MSQIRIPLMAFLTVGVLFSFTHTHGDAGPPETLDGFERFVSADGVIRFDPGAIEALAHLGSWFVPDGGAAGFHHVYTQRGAIEAFRSTGEFPDGTVLVKELTGHARGDYTTGRNVAHATATTQWFVMVKDTRNRFPGNALWGEGWGWALFEKGAPGSNAAQSYEADCLGCHQPAASTDWIYVDAYPALRQ